MSIPRGIVAVDWPEDRRHSEALYRKGCPSVATLYSDAHSPVTYCCTLVRGHPGPHEAGTGAGVVAVWPRGVREEP